jgi:hypothetical protein
MYVCCGFGDLDWGCFVFAPWGTRRPGRIAASQPSRPSQSSLTHTHPPFSPPHHPRSPKNQNQDCQNIGRKCFRGRVYRPSTGTTWLAGSDIYIYMCVCVCVFVWVHMWCAVAAEPIVCSERPGMNNLWFKFVFSLWRHDLHLFGLLGKCFSHVLLKLVFNFFDFFKND